MCCRLFTVAGSLKRRVRPQTAARLRRSSWNDFPGPRGKTWRLQSSTAITERSSEGLRGSAGSPDADPPGFRLSGVRGRRDTSTHPSASAAVYSLRAADVGGRTQLTSKATRVQLPPPPHTHTHNRSHTEQEVSLITPSDIKRP